MATGVIDKGVVTEITTNGVTRVAPERRSDWTAPVVWAVLRVLMGATFLWAFLDKAFALGFSTGRNPETGAPPTPTSPGTRTGGSPSDGVLMYALKGPFKGLYDGLAGQAWVEWVYMLSMLLIGLGLIFGVGTRLAALGGIVWMAIFYTATAIWPEHNPFIDDHVVYAIVLAGIAFVGAGRYYGLGEYWESLPLVKRLPILK